MEGDLFKFLSKRNKLFFEGTPVSDETARKLQLCMKQVAEGLKFLHENDIVHRDMKPDNILYDHGSNWKISDLGLTKVVDSLMTPRVGTPLYMAPEQTRRRYDSRVDVYAFGLIMFEICYPMKDEQHYKDTFNGLRNSTPRFPGKEARLSNYTTKHTNLIRGMIEHKPDSRTSIEDVLTFLQTTDH